MPVSPGNRVGMMDPDPDYGDDLDLDPAARDLEPRTRTRAPTDPETDYEDSVAKSRSGSNAPPPDYPDEDSHPLFQDPAPDYPAIDNPAFQPDLDLHSTTKSQRSRTLSMPETDYSTDDDVITSANSRDLDLPSRRLTRPRPSVQFDLESAHDEADGVFADSTKFRSIREGRIRRRKSIHNAVFRRGSVDHDVTDDVASDLVSSPDQGTLTLDSRSSALRDMPTSLRHKRSIREKMTTLDRKKMKKPSWSKRTAYGLSMTIRHLRMKVAAVTYSLGFWQGHLKTVEGHFGTGVASYFIFLRTLFLLNVPLFILSFSFIVIPQLLYRFLQKVPQGYTENKNFTGLELLTGSGWLKDTVMYYGYYINGTINVFSGHTNGSWLGLTGPSYHMQYAYLLTCAGFYLLSLIILGHKTAKSYRKNYVDSSGSIQEHFIVKVLNGWDFTIMDRQAAQLRHKFVYKEMREYLSTTKKSRRHKSCGEWCRLVLVRIVANLMVLGMIAGSAFLIYYLYTSQSLKTNLQFLREMALPLCLCAFNIVMPAAFSMIGAIEKYGKPRVTLYMALIRTMLMKGVTLGVLIYFWLVQLNCHQKDIEGLDLQDVLETKECVPCWETYMGQEIYRLVLVDFFAYLISVFLLEFCRRLLSDHCCKYLGKPEFDIGRNTLDLIFSQALCWLGAFYSPLISLIQLVKLFILFYLKRFSVMSNCAPSQKPWRAARTSTVFLAFLCSAFLMMAVSVAMSIIVIKPSTTCGPFRGLNSTYDVILTLVDDWRTEYPGLSGCIQFFTSEGALSGLIITLVCFVYYLRIMAKGRQELVEVLLHQVRLEGRDKNFLLRKYQEIQNQGPVNHRYFPSKPATTSLPQISVEIDGHLSPKAARSAVTPPTPYTEITPSSESVLPLTDYSDGLTPDSFTPASETPGITSGSATPKSSATPSRSSKSVTIAVTPDSEQSDEITAREMSNPSPDYFHSSKPDCGVSEEIELRDFDRDAGLDRDSQLSDHTDYNNLWS